MKKTVFITGASTGIGLATAKLFAKRGWNVVATMRNPESADASLKENGIFVLKLDVTSETSIHEALSSALEQFGKIDVLVNNAGYGIVGAFEATPTQNIRRQFETNVFGLMSMTKEILPHFRENRSGVIVNISSVGGRATFPLFSLYHSTKFAVEGFTESLQFELEPLGIRLKLVEPGPVHTDFGSRSADRIDTSNFTDYSDFQSKMLEKVANGAKGGQTPDQVAEVIYKAAQTKAQDSATSLEPSQKQCYSLEKSYQNAYTDFLSS